jgi:hypothetical protein
VWGWHAARQGAGRVTSTTTQRRNTEMDGVRTDRSLPERRRWALASCCCWGWQRCWSRGVCRVRVRPCLRWSAVKHSWPVWCARRWRSGRVGRGGWCRGMCPGGRDEARGRDGLVEPAWARSPRRSWLGCRYVGWLPALHLQEQLTHQRLHALHEVTQLTLVPGRDVEQLEARGIDGLHRVLQGSKRDPDALQ